MPDDGGPLIERISAITLAVRDMGRSLAFYRGLGFPVRYGGEEADFTSLMVGDDGYLNLILQREGSPPTWWGRIILHVRNVDEMYRRAVATGFVPDAGPVDAVWGERYFHISDPDGHELSFAMPSDRPAADDEE